jgi:hypothetical protein
LPPVLLTPVANLPLAGDAPRLAEIFAKFEMTLLLFSGAWEKMIHEKKPEAKNLVTLSLKQLFHFKLRGHTNAD